MDYTKIIKELKKEKFNKSDLKYINKVNNENFTRDDIRYINNHLKLKNKYEL